jgi:NAD(P)H-flavin reductase
MTTKHVHKFNKLVPIKDYGSVRVGFVQRIILTRECTCGSTEAIDCGSPEKMRALWKKLNEAKR